MTGARYDKHGRRLPETGRGCGCRLCEESNAPRYERRSAERDEAAGSRPVWHPATRFVYKRLAESLPHVRSVYKRGAPTT